MTDLERRTLIHLLDGQELMIAWASGTDRKVAAEATLEWMKENRAIRGELEDCIPDDYPDDRPLPFTIPGVN